MGSLAQIRFHIESILLPPSLVETPLDVVAYSFLEGCQFACRREFIIDGAAIDGLPQLQTHRASHAIAERHLVLHGEVHRAPLIDEPSEDALLHPLVDQLDEETAHLVGCGPMVEVVLHPLSAILSLGDCQANTPQPFHRVEAYDRFGVFAPFCAFHI